MVHQNPELGTSPGLSAPENLALALASRKRLGFHKLLSNDRVVRSQGILRELGIDANNRFTTPVCEFSGGQRQALAIHMAVLREPKILLLDEPTAALDPRRANELGVLTERLWREHNLTVLMVTHQVTQALKFGNRLLFMHAGRIVRDVSGMAKQQLTFNELTELYQTAYESTIN
jgi:putative ABC transport system ATP-binding protein